MIILGSIIVSINNGKLIAAAVAVGGAFLIGVVVASICAACSERERDDMNVCKKVVETILVEESPLPTRSAKLMSSESHRRMAQSMRARRRGGHRRYGDHRRRVTLLHNPTLPNHCGFECLLKAARLRVTEDTIMDLRMRTAERVYMGFLADQIVHGMSIREMIEKSEENLNSYLAKLKWNLWASPLEICIAAEVLGVPVAISVGKAIFACGEGPKHVIRLHKSHYTLHRLRKTLVEAGRVTYQRGGMHNTTMCAASPSASAAASSSWQWQHAQLNTVSILSLPPAATVAEVREETPEWALPTRAPPGLTNERDSMHIVNIDVSPTLRTDIVSLRLTIRSDLEVSAFRQRVAAILQVPGERLLLQNQMGDVLPEHLGVPTYVQANDQWARDSAVYDMLHVTVEGVQHVKFVVMADPIWVHQQLVDHVAKILGKDPQQVHITDVNGALWRYPEDRLRTSTLTVTLTDLPVDQVDLLGYLAEQRGGARTVSTTQAYQTSMGEHYVLDECHQPNPDPHEERQDLQVQRVNDDDETEVEGNDGQQQQLCEAHREQPVLVEDSPEAARARQLRADHAYRPVAMVEGGVLYDANARMLTAEALARHERRQRSRSRSRGSHRRSPNTVASTSADSQVMITATVLPHSPPPAQPEVVVRPVFDDVGPVGTLQAYPTALASDVVLDFINQVKPGDLVQVLPMHAVLWREVERILMPPQPRVSAFRPLDMRSSRWELYQNIREVPVLVAGTMIHTLILPWHLSLAQVRLRIADHAPHNMHWMLMAVTPDDWVVFQLLLPRPVREELEDLERRRQQERGGMRAQPKLPLKVHIKHADDIQEWKVDHDMTLEYFLDVLALEFDTQVMNILIMRGKHIPGLEESILSYLPIIRVYVIDRMPTDSHMTADQMMSGVLWQRAKKGKRPWQSLPVPKGLPQVYSPEPTPPMGLIHCYLKPAHDPEEMYVVHVAPTATVADVLRNLEAITQYRAESMLLVKEGCVIATYENAAVCNPMSFLLLGDKLHCVDLCAAQAVDWSDLWSVSHTTEQGVTPRGGHREGTLDYEAMQLYMNYAEKGTLESVATWLKSPMSLLRFARGGARPDRTGQQPRAVMIVWAEDKIRREIEGVNPLTVRMLLKAEQRTVSAILHTRSATQTREVLQAAYRRAGLSMQAPQQLQEQQQEQQQTQPPQEALTDMVRALHNQATITTQIADRLAASPTNLDFVKLLDTVNGQMEMQQVLISQTERIMLYLQLVHGPNVIENFRAQETPGRRSRTEQSTQDYQEEPNEHEGQHSQQRETVSMDLTNDNDQDHVEEQQEIVRQPATPDVQQQHPTQDLMPTPRREPASFAPAGLSSNISQGFRQASQRSRRSEAVGPAVRPFRSRQ